MSDRFDVQQHKGGQLYVSEDGEQVLHARVNAPMDVTIDVGPGSRVEIDKLYGPLIFWPIRVHLDIDACEWVIERQSGSDEEWHEWTRIPGQMAEDYTDED